MSSRVKNYLSCINPFTKLRRKTDAEKDFSESSAEQDIIKLSYGRQYESLTYQLMVSN